MSSQAIDSISQEEFRGAPWPKLLDVTSRLLTAVRRLMLTRQPKLVSLGWNPALAQPAVAARRAPAESPRSVRRFDRCDLETSCRYYLAMQWSPSDNAHTERIKREVGDALLAWARAHGRGSRPIVDRFADYLQATGARARDGVLVGYADRLTFCIALRLDDRIPPPTHWRIAGRAILLSTLHDIVHATLELLRANRLLEACGDHSDTPGLLSEILRHWKVRVRVRAMTSLRGCMVRTPFGAAIHLNASLPKEQHTLVILHELAHLRFGHRGTTEIPFGPKLGQTQSASFIDWQEVEADYAARVWQLGLDQLSSFLVDQQGFFDHPLLPDDPMHAVDPKHATLT